MFRSTALFVSNRACSFLYHSTDGFELAALFDTVNVEDHGGLTGLMGISCLSITRPVSSVLFWTLTW